MNSKKDLFITAVQLTPIDGARTIPTAVYYNNGRPIIGHEALDQPALTEHLRDDFKIELGMKDPTALAAKHTRLDGTTLRSPIGTAKDFCDGVLSKLANELGVHGEPYPKRILIAEPLSLGGGEAATDSWLANYRAALRRILHGRFEEIDFMPEPFAVFQYYRYGLKHALIAQKQKHIALVMDFGGGTFDVSVIETTTEGDISQSGRHSRPLSASSIPVGGFYVNKLIAEDLLFETIEKKASKRAIRNAINKFDQVKNYDAVDHTEIRDDMLRFFNAYRTLLRDVEDAKISICSSVPDWRVDADLGNAAAIRVRVPRRPLSTNSDTVEVRLHAERIRRIFEDRVWRQKLLPAIRSGLARASQALGGKSLSVVLLSGGSSNMRWLTQLIERDLRSDLAEAEVLELSEDFQEIVAKGLAVECARRYYTKGEGDFRAVTYNRLCLSLNPNGNGAETRRYRPSSDHLPKETYENGVLLPSASSLRGRIDKPLRWKTKLSTTPSRYLDYHFLRSSFDPDDLDNLHNVVDKTVDTPAGTKFGGTIEIELTVRDDGTALPRFIYGRGGNRGQQVVVDGNPFYMDMTFAAEEVSGDTYLGFDFGTSTSAFSFVKNSDVDEFKHRSKDSSWRDLNDLVQALPYPMAYPLASFIAETSKEGLEKWGRETLECMLSVAAYVCYVEYLAKAGTSAASMFKGYEHRSAGPLWDLLNKCSKALGERAIFSKYAAALTRGDIASELNSAVNEVAQAKHGKAARGLDYPRIIGLVGNVLAKSFAENHMGYFEDVRQAQFSFGNFEGIFRSIQGPHAPFGNLFEYQGEQGVPSGLVFLISPERGLALNLSPLIISGLKPLPGMKGPEVHLFDIYRHKDDTFGFKAVQEDEEFRLEADSNFGEIHEQLSAMREGPALDPVLRKLKLSRKT